MADGLATARRRLGGQPIHREPRPRRGWEAVSSIE